MKVWLRSSFVSLILFAVPAAAGDLHATYVTADDISLRRVLPPPPEPGSAQQAADLAAVEAAVRSRTSEDEKEITAERSCSGLAFASDIMGPGFTEVRVPLTLALIKRAFEDAELVVLSTKTAIDRARPYTLVPTLATFGHRSDSPSYPSGHATCGRVMAIILAAMVPAKAHALFARGERYGHNRLVAGTHFPSDLDAGDIAGSVIAAALFRSPRFKSDFATAQAEARAALGF